MTRPELARLLDLDPHPEGGWYRRVYTSPLTVPVPGRMGARPTATLIHYLLGPGETSAWHRVASDEVWLWHSGGPLVLRTAGAGARPAPRSQQHLLGPDLNDGHRVQVTIAADTWQSARPATDEAVLVSCLVTPGFDFEDFTLWEPTSADSGPGV